jgi:hypothetical protein
MSAHNFKDFEALLHSPFKEVQALARKAQTYKEAFDAKEISEGEYNDLIKDLTNLDNIDRALLSADIWNGVMAAVTIIKTLRSLAII